ncbi:MAG: DNA polymerase III, partial [Chloroflexi bacterium]|nr:DNA polymerase III [Chloroflexota bacterium]
MSEDEPRSNANAEVARLFAEIGDILELKGEPIYRYNAYRTAARSVGSATERLDDLFKEGRLRQLPGVGGALEAKIIEYLTTGRMEFFDQIRRDFPAGLASLMQVPGLGPSKARALYKQLGVSSAAELEQAARDGRLRDVPGFSDKLAENVLASLERLKQRSGRSLLSDAWVAVHQVQQALGSPTEADRIAVVGSVRRMQDTVGGVDLLAARDDLEEAERLVDGLLRLPNLVEVRERASDSATVRLYGGLDVRLIIVPRMAWGSALVWYTGSHAHVTRLEQLASERGWTFSALGLEDELTGQRLAGESEVELYERLGLVWTPPELR